MSLLSPSCIPIWLAPPKKISTNFPACADPLICTCGDLGWANQWVRTTIACGAKQPSPKSPWRNVFATSCCLSFFATKICKPQHQTGLGIFWMSGSLLDRLLISKIRCKHLRVRLRQKQPTWIWFRIWCHIISLFQTNTNVVWLEWRLENVYLSTGC